MSIATLDEVASFDEFGSIEGLQFDSRERRIQEWRERKEDDEFKQLVDSLHKRNYMRRAMADPEKRKRIQEAQRRHRRSGRKQRRANELRREKYEANPVVNTCRCCGFTWTVPFDQKGQRHSKYCSRRCRNRDHNRQRPTMGIRQMDIKEKTLEYLGTVEAATSREVADAIGGKLTSMRVMLSRWAMDGLIKSDGRRPAKYSI